MLGLDLILASLRMACPLVFASLGGLMSERSGIVNMALEGLLLLGAFVAAVATYYFKSPWIGIGCAFISGIIAGAIISGFILVANIDAIIAGMSFNLLTIGSLPLFSKYLFDSTGATPGLSIELRLQSSPLIFTLMTVVIAFSLFKYLRLGLWIKVCGENPEALRSQGISIVRIRTVGLVFGSGLAAIGGSFLSLYLSSSYSPLMSGGRGFIALAAIVFGRWQPVWISLACIFFGLMDSIQMRLQGLKIGNLEFPVQFIQIIPYVAVLALPIIIKQKRKSL